MATKQGTSPDSTPSDAKSSAIQRDKVAKNAVEGRLIAVVCVV